MEIKNQIIQAQVKIIDKLAVCEKTISELYALYSEIFPDQKEFWMELSREEQGHATLLQSMHRQLEKNELFHNIGRFDLASIESFLVQVNRAIADAKDRSVSPLQGIKMGLFIESSLLEAHFYDIVQSDDEAFKSVADSLSKDTQRHIKNVQNKLMEMQSNLTP